MNPKPPDPQAIVIFGASGDLTKRKLLPALFHLYCEGLLPHGFAVVGYARTKMSDDEFREYTRDAIKNFGRAEPSGEVWTDFAKHLSYIAGEFNSELAMEELREHLEDMDRAHGTAGGRFYYCATPPVAYPQVVRRLSESYMHAGAKIVIEKPFGRDLDTARRLNRELHQTFEERQIFRIDHYLGKETIQNVLAFRFANGMFEPIWNRRYVDNIQITVAEEIGIEGRGAFYEQTGTLRDMVQTHLLQVLTFIAMEPPVSFDPERLRDEKAKVLLAMEPVGPDRVVRAQYVGYRDEPDVAADSQGETYAALEVRVDNWRWAGVPFYLRTGKHLKRKDSELTMVFRDVPYNAFKDTEAGRPKRDHLTFRVQPNEGITVAFNVKTPGPGLRLHRATMNFSYQQTFHAELIEAYETLLLEAMNGDHTLFTREDEVERAWEVLMPVLERPPSVVFYEKGSWGPQEADALIAPHRWHVSHERRDRDDGDDDSGDAG
jgi:glucose-6-phosphate 1-dehydrogenase